MLRWKFVLFFSRYSFFFYARFYLSEVKGTSVRTNTCSSVIFWASTYMYMYSVGLKITRSLKSFSNQRVILYWTRYDMLKIIKCRSYSYKLDVMAFVFNNGYRSDCVICSYGVFSLIFDRRLVTKIAKFWITLGINFLCFLPFFFFFYILLFVMYVWTGEKAFWLSIRNAAR